MDTIFSSIVNGQHLWANIIAAILGAAIGGTFADIDLAPPLPIKHRSLWTHGPFVPFGLLLAIPLYPLLWWFGVGFLPAFAIHLVKDMWPQRWHGGALIKCYPIDVTLPAFLSFIWLAFSVGYTLSVLWRLVW